MNKFAERIKELRLDRNLSILGLSKQINLSDSAIGRWERAEQVPNIEVLIIYADFFGVTTDYLLGREY